MWGASASFAKAEVEATLEEEEKKGEEEERVCSKLPATVSWLEEEEDDSSLKVKRDGWREGEKRRRRKGKWVAIYSNPLTLAREDREEWNTECLSC